MKLKITLLAVFYIVLLNAQAPAGYYNAANGLNGYPLKTALHQIITNSHNPQAYSTHWSFFQIADVKQDGTVWDIYANCGFVFGLPENGGNQDVGTGGNVECQFFNREHTFPTSWFGGNVEPMRSDVVHIYPADKLVNNERGNLAFAAVNSVSFLSSNGSKKGTSATPGITGNVFEVIDEYKGDIARSLFYMATRYQDVIAGWETNNPDGDKMLNGTSNQVFETWALQLLYSWHINDPVSQKEINRNNAIYAYQGNRNPFVDNPDYVCNIWNVSNCTLSVPEINFENAITVYPNPSNNQTISIESSIELDEIQLISINGQLLQVIQKENITANQLQINSIPSGFYLLKVKSSNQYITKKIIIN